MCNHYRRLVERITSWYVRSNKTKKWKYRRLFEVLSISHIFLLFLGFWEEMSKGSKLTRVSVCFFFILPIELLGISKPFQQYKKFHCTVHCRQKDWVTMQKMRALTKWYSYFDFNEPSVVSHKSGPILINLCTDHIIHQLHVHGLQQ